MKIRSPEESLLTKSLNIGYKKYKLLKQHYIPLSQAFSLFSGLITLSSHSCHTKSGATRSLSFASLSIKRNSCFTG